MADKKQQIAYGQAGGRGNQGAGLSRFDIAGDPSRYYPIWAGRSMETNTPPWLLEDGIPATYAGKAVGTYGMGLNLFSDGSILRACMRTPGEDLVAQDIIWTLGGTAYNVLTESANKYKLVEPEIPCFTVNGEHCWRTNDGTAGQISPVAEQFVFAASTITVTNGSPNVTVSLANGLTTAATLGGYAYTPAFNAPRAGDVLEVVDTISRFFRITAITGATTATIFPAYNGTGGAGKVYRIWRTGYGSFSDMVDLLDYTTGDLYHYYAGNTINAESNWGTVECIKRAAGGALTHFMAPTTVDALGVSTGVTPNAVGVAYFKGFLLYGSGPGIGWTVAPFPSSFTTGFGTTDFPAANFSAFNRQGVFMYFEHVGEQLTAIFDESVWLVQNTGSVPEFQFYRLSEPIGTSKPTANDPQGVGSCYPRSSCSGRNAVFYNSLYGNMALSGLQTKRISEFYEANQGASTFTFPGYGANYTYDKYSDNVVMTTPVPGSGYPILYQPGTDSWYRLLPTNAGHGLTAGIVTAINIPYRRFGLAHWEVNSNRIKVIGVWPENDGGLVGSNEYWCWPSRIIACGEIYSGFIFGGFRLLARAQGGATPPINLTWTVWGGSTPNNMAIKETGTADYTYGTNTARELIGGRQEDAFIGIVLEGHAWIELAGVAIYDAANESTR